MLNPAHENSGPPVRPLRRRRRLAAVAMFPTMLTLGNLIFGFGAIYQCGLEMRDLGAGVKFQAKRTLNSDFAEARAPSYLSIAVWMLVASAICDALDGRVARLAKKSSKFGEQLDSLADVVSFGAAPALMMVTLMRREIEQLGYAPFGIPQFGRLALFIGVIYACCTALRLARFNVETSLDESAHRGFTGLPSPGAAGAVVSVILLHDHLDQKEMWPAVAGVLTRAYPFLTLLIALLMVSRVPYTHAVSLFFRRRPMEHVVGILLLLPFLIIYSEITLFLMAWAFVLSGPIRMLLHRNRPQAAPVAGLPAAPSEVPRPKSME